MGVYLFLAFFCQIYTADTDQDGVCSGSPQNIVFMQMHDVTVQVSIKQKLIIHQGVSSHTHTRVHKCINDHHVGSSVPIINGGSTSLASIMT